MKTVLLLVLLGALLGIAAASFVVPPALSWYNAPGDLQKSGQVQALVNIPEVIRYATNRLIKGQAIGAGIGAFGGLVLGVFVTSSGRKGRQAAPSPGSAVSGSKA